MTADTIKLAISNRIAACEDRGFTPTRVFVGTVASRALATVLPTWKREVGCGLAYAHLGAMVPLYADETMGERVMVVGVLLGRDRVETWS